MSNKSLIGEQDEELPKAPSKRLMSLARMRSRDLYFVRHDRVFYCMRVTPQKETMVSQLLHDKGVDTFIPVAMRWRRKNRTSREKHQVPFVAFPGYLIMGVKSRAFPWWVLNSIPHIQGVLGFQGVPQPLNATGAQKFLGKFREGLEPPKSQKNMRSNAEYDVGDNVEVMEGAYMGHIVKVSSIRGKKAEILINLFGDETKASIDAYSLEKVA